MSQQVNELVYYSKKGNLKRNSKCPCGSGQKVKNCHSHFLEIRHYVIQREMQISNQLAAHNREANLGKQGYHRMTRQQFIDTLDVQESKEKLSNEIQTPTE